MSVFVGDSPARAFEAGNQINGHFPCHCGGDARKFRTSNRMNPPKYMDLADRMAKIRLTTLWDNRKTGDLAVFENLDVSIQII